jgi:hypothetical protein
LQSLNLFECNIHQIENLNNKDHLRYLILGNNPIYKNFRRAVLKRKKLSRLTEEERTVKGINPRLWELASNFRGKLLSDPKIPQIKPKSKHMTGDGKSSSNARAGMVLEAGRGCCECLSVVVLLLSLVPLLRLLF